MAQPVTVAEGNGRHSHRHTHAQGRASRSSRRLSIVLMLTLLYMCAEALGGWWTGSLALLADAGHALTDVASLALALLAVWFGSRPATSSKTFGSDCFLYLLRGLSSMGGASCNQEHADDLRGPRWLGD
jgi:Co/Zn/Cd efflux system component